MSLLPSEGCGWVRFPLTTHVCEGFGSTSITTSVPSFNALFQGYIFLEGLANLELTVSFLYEVPESWVWFRIGYREPILIPRPPKDEHRCTKTLLPTKTHLTNTKQICRCWKITWYYITTALASSPLECMIKCNNVLRKFSFAPHHTISS